MKICFFISENEPASDDGNDSGQKHIGQTKLENLRLLHEQGAERNGVAGHIGGAEKIVIHRVAKEGANGENDHVSGKAGDIVEQNG